MFHPFNASPLVFPFTITDKCGRPDEIHDKTEKDILNNAQNNRLHHISRADFQILCINPLEKGRNRQYRTIKRIEQIT